MVQRAPRDRCGSNRYAEDHPRGTMIARRRRATPMPGHRGAMRLVADPPSLLSGGRTLSTFSRISLRNLDPWRTGLLLLVVVTSGVIGGNLLFIFWSSVLDGSVGDLGHSYSFANYTEIFSDPFV